MTETYGGHVYEIPDRAARLFGLIVGNDKGLSTHVRSKPLVLFALLCLFSSVERPLRPTCVMGTWTAAERTGRRASALRKERKTRFML